MGFRVRKPRARLSLPLNSYVIRASCSTTLSFRQTQMEDLSENTEFKILFSGSEIVLQGYCKDQMRSGVKNA